MSAPAIVLVGCGRLGGALARGWAGRANVFILDPSPEPFDGAARLTAPAEVAGLPRPLIIVLAVKPASVAQAAADLAPFLDSAVTVVSVAAGVSLRALRRLVGPKPTLARAMPNTAAAIGAGMTAFVMDAGADGHAVEAAFALVGETSALADEALMDAVTAVSGSGPAYFFLLAEHLAKAGVAQGLEPSIAEALARATLAGAGASVGARADSLVSLGREVESPGGTTQAALERFRQAARLERLVIEAVEAAATRASALRRQHDDSLDLAAAGTGG